MENKNNPMTNYGEAVETIKVAICKVNTWRLKL